MYEAWRGDVLAQFLIQLQTVTKTGVAFFDKNSPFSIKAFIYNLKQKLHKYNPELIEIITPCLINLEQKFMSIHDQCPLSFCHGDYHPLNVIWEKDCIAAVIDWEFTGYKPEIYDVANMVGCVGMEDPVCLTGELLVQFITTIKKSNIFSPISWDYFMDFVIALRFAWFSEWLHKSDWEMVELEGVYMNLLLNIKDKLQKEWNL